MRETSRSLSIIDRRHSRREGLAGRDDVDMQVAIRELQKATRIVNQRLRREESRHRAPDRDYCYDRTPRQERSRGTRSRNRHRQVPPCTTIKRPRSRDRYRRYEDDDRAKSRGRTRSRTRQYVHCGEEPSSSSAAPYGSANPNFSFLFFFPAVFGPAPFNYDAMLVPLITL